MTSALLGEAVEASLRTRRRRPPVERNVLEALSEADTPDRIVHAMDTAAERFGFQFAQVMLVAPTPEPSAFAIKEWSDKVIIFDRAVGAASDLASPYDHDVGDPVRISANVTAHFGHRDRRRGRASEKSFRQRDRRFRRS